MILDSSPAGTIEVLFKWKKVVIGIFALIVCAAGIYLKVTTPQYQSEAELVVRFGDHSVPEPQRTERTEVATSDRQEIVAANAEILKSPHLAQATIASFGLDKVYPEVVANPPAAWTPMQEAVRRFGKALSVDVGERDNVITVKFMHPDSAMAQAIIRRLIELYIQNQTSIYENPELSFLENSVAQERERLAGAQKALEAFKTTWQITDIDQEVIALLKQRSDAATSLATAEATAQQAQHRQADLHQLLTTIQKYPMTPAGDRYRALDEAQARLADLQAQQAQALAAPTPDAAQLAQLRSAIADASHDVDARRADVVGRAPAETGPVYQSVQTAYLQSVADAQSAGAPVAVLTKALAAINQRLGDLQQARGTYDQLSRAESIEASAYRSLSDQAEDARVKDSLNRQNISPATIISAPTLPYRPAKPRFLLTLVAAVFGGAILAVGAALVLEAMDDRFTTGAQVAARLGVPLLATFGPVRDTRRRGLKA